MPTFAASFKPWQRRVVASVFDAAPSGGDSVSARLIYCELVDREAAFRALTALSAGTAIKLDDTRFALTDRVRKRIAAGEQEAEVRFLREWLCEPLGYFVDAAIAEDDRQLERWAWAPMALWFESERLVHIISASIQAKPDIVPSASDQALTLSPVLAATLEAPVPRLPALDDRELRAADKARREQLLAAMESRVDEARELEQEIRALAAKPVGTLLAELSATRQRILVEGLSWPKWARLQLRVRIHRQFAERAGEEQLVQANAERLATAHRRLEKLGDTCAAALGPRG